MNMNKQIKKSETNNPPKLKRGERILLEVMKERSQQENNLLVNEIKTEKTIQERLSQIPKLEKAKMMFLINKRKKEQKIENKKKIISLIKGILIEVWNIIIILFGMLLMWLFITMPIGLILWILVDYNIFQYSVYDKGVDYVGWIVFCVCLVYGVKFYYDLIKERKESEKRKVKNN